MMSKHSVCGVVVTYDPSAEVLSSCLAALVPQVDCTLIVDNSTALEAQANVTRVVETFNRSPDDGWLVLFQNKANVGLAKALNLGMGWAFERDFEFVLLLDQDSILEERAVVALERAYQTVGIASPSVALAATNVERNPTSLMAILDRFLYGLAPRRAGLHQSRVAMTSGLFISRGLANLVGPFDEAFFLDGCDHDFSLRLRRSGGEILTVGDARISHNLGSPTGRNGREAWPYLRYQSPERYYYITRDSLRVAGRHLGTDPLYSLTIGSLAVGRLAILGLRSSRARRQFIGAINGLRDLLAGKQGKRSDAGGGSKSL